MSTQSYCWPIAFTSKLCVITPFLKENEDSKDYKWMNIGSDYSGDKDKDGVRVAKFLLRGLKKNNF